MNNDPKLLEFPLFTASLNEKGEWIYKSKEGVKLNGSLKAQYKDLPRVKAIYELEANVKENFKETVVRQSIKEINDKLIEFSRA